MVPYQPAETTGIQEFLRRFGAELRRCREQAGLSQMMLAERSGVAQSTISRLERGLAAHAAMYKLVLLIAALGRRLPLAYCPHEHQCTWSRLDADGRAAEITHELGTEPWRIGGF